MIYLDNAATSFPKPASVTREQMLCMQRACGNPGRGAHTLSRRASETVYECREAVASLFSSPNPENVIFTMNTTMALNIAIKGLLREGDHVLLSDMEHNAVLRPIHKLFESGRITYELFPTYPTTPEKATPKRICAEILERIRPNTRMLVCAHASNICSASLPLAEIGVLCRQRGILFVVDGAQSAGHLPIDMERMQIDALCVPGHKGLLGPPGTGCLLLGAGVIADTLIEGGSGYNSRDVSMPEDAPERYEAGTLPTAALAGLCTGVREVQQRGIAAIHEHTCALVDQLAEHLREIRGIELYAPHHRGGVLLFNANGIPADRLGEALDAHGFCVRSGLHCAPLAHKTLGTPPSGAVRVSPSIFNTSAHIIAFADCVRELVNAKK
ncbi:MAG: aminotransferase class V-fold PLP-dependent enzyme [Clostridia bacterium]|nr:aminotransferase class V-fold PLP-dependent enzyme [Clostridia bacterium]MBQ9774262.1 aminotransferase class V-fold PLP-dependent enzyme [Clostridia bacterium]